MRTYEISFVQGEIVDIHVDNVRVKAGFMRGIKKAQKTSYWKVFYGNKTTFKNPWSGVEVDLNPLEATIYNFCNEWMKRYSAGLPTEAPIQAYDDMKYFLLGLNTQAYYDLVD